mmetsp:Transcript_20232/g.30014  ORF Transcript_20232/g.30014 Transcript_20232/m.30014 type:complete len:290 (-) Transcript_20232:88-957(-)
MSNLVTSVQQAILEYVNSKQETHIETDVLRIIRDQASLLYERQLILDALTQDPMQQFLEHKNEVARLKELLSVVSCDRVVTYEGLSSIKAVVQFRRDTEMNGIDSYIQLCFDYERKPMQQNDIVSEDRNIKGQGTYIKYKIDFKKDHQQKHSLLNVECWAGGESPSVQPAVPLDGWDDMDDEDDNQMDIAKEAETQNGNTSEEDMEDLDEDKADRFAAYIDPEIMESLLHCSGIKMEEGTMFFLLMTFPFWEHEWDLVGFVLDVVFGEEYDDNEDEVIEFDDDGNEMVA